MKKIAAVLVLACFAGSVLAQQTLKPEEMIKIRKSGYSFMSWNMGKIKANLDGTFNKDQVIAAAKVVAATANSGMGALFAPGTENDVGDQKTRVKPEFFQPQNQDKLKEVAGNYIREANELAKVAETGDVAAIKAQFGKTGGACKGCHDEFRKN
jgi:cytochrome c556